MKTVSLELAKQLKEAGYPQYSEFMWSNWYYGELKFGEGKENFQGEYRIIHIPPFNDPKNQFAAPTADEILDSIEDFISLNRGSHGYIATIPSISTSQAAETINFNPAACLAKLWLIKY